MVTWEKSKHPLAVALRGHNVSQRQVCMAAGVHTSTMSRVLRGELPGFTARSARKLLPVVRRYGVTMEQLIMGEE
jgi:transcriptional regulator with XRE-family HTH domain